MFVIRGFGDKRTEDIFNGVSSKKARSFPANLLAIVRRKLDLINEAGALSDLRAPPGNKLEVLKGDLAGNHSVRINKQWRIIFRWKNGDTNDVTIVDYH